MSTKYPNLVKAIEDSGKSKTYLASKIGVTRQGFHNKLNGNGDFSADEAIILSSELGITTIARFKEIFFTN